jgi:hypothetical protein
MDWAIDPPDKKAVWPVNAKKPGCAKHDRTGYILWTGIFGGKKTAKPAPGLNQGA